MPEALELFSSFGFRERMDRRGKRTPIGDSSFFEEMLREPLNVSIFNGDPREDRCCNV